MFRWFKDRMLYHFQFYGINTKFVWRVFCVVLILSLIVNYFSGNFLFFWFMIGIGITFYIIDHISFISFNINTHGYKVAYSFYKFRMVEWDSSDTYDAASLIDKHKLKLFIITTGLAGHYFDNASLKRGRRILAYKSDADLMHFLMLFKNG